MKLFMIAILTHLFITISFGQTLWNGTGHIPQEAQCEWFKAGLLPNTSTIAAYLIEVDSKSGNDDEKIESSILNALDYTDFGLVIIQFSARVYYLNNEIELDYSSNAKYSNIVFQGEGTNTVLRFNISKNENCFKIYGFRSSETSVLSEQSVSKRTSAITPINSSGFSEGDWIHFYEYNFPIEGTSTNYVGQITQIKSINGGTYILEDEFSRGYHLPDVVYKGDDLRIDKIIPIQNIGIENLKIVRDNSGKADEGYDGSNIYFDYAVNCWVRGIYSDHTSRHHIAISYSSHILINGSYFLEANSKGDGGYGYGVNLERSSNYCLIENNILKKLRHSLLMEKGANTNVLSFNYSRYPEW